MLDSLSEQSIDETSARYDGWRIVAVCFLVATFGWGFGFYGQSVYVAELHRLHGWPASLISGGTTFFYLFGALLVASVSEAIRGFGPRNCLVAGVLALATAVVLIGQVTEPWQLYAADAVLAFGWARDQSRDYHQHAWPLVRQEARHGDQSCAEWGKFWRHRRRSPAGSRDRAFWICRRHDRSGNCHGRADDPHHSDFRRTAADRFECDRGGQSGRSVGHADPQRGISRRGVPDRMHCIRAGAVCAGRIHRPPDFVPRSRDRTGTRRHRGGAVDRDGD